MEQEFLRAPSPRPATASRPVPQAPQGRQSPQRKQGDRFGTGGRGLPGLLWNRGAGRRERELSEKYGLTIGPASKNGGHFSHSELNKLDKVLGGLPRNDLEYDAHSLEGIVRGGGDMGPASLYDGETRKVHVQHPWGMPGWLYTKLQKGSGWQRRLMDLGAALNYQGLSMGQKCSVMGCSHNRRQVMGGALAHGSLFSWTMRHEIGHSVDERCQWKMVEARKPEFGGWLLHEGQLGHYQVACAFLAPYGITDDEVRIWLADRIAPDPEGNPPALSDALIGEFTRDWPDATEQMGHEALRQLLADLKFATAQPWMLPDGGADRLTRDGRVYQVSHYGEWCSYLASAREHVVSPYQFSCAEEWFAEAYAAYHDPVAGHAPRRRLHPDAAAWFEKKARKESQG
ncbi:hypothetical protein ACFP1Z_12435 [Streptomyces gamaensis]|uniref:Uncharacterized protein n=1 Tax=Streptomyces gamaensis TaxID=1763542 RepID=A0ABW0Z3J4_9ACTN